MSMWCQVDLLMTNCGHSSVSMKYLHSFIRCKGEKRINRLTDRRICGQPNYLMLPAHSSDRDTTMY